MDSDSCNLRWGPGKCRSCRRLPCNARTSNFSERQLPRFNCSGPVLPTLTCSLRMTQFSHFFPRPCFLGTLSFFFLIYPWGGLCFKCKGRVRLTGLRDKFSVVGWWPTFWRLCLGVYNFRILSNWNVIWRCFTIKIDLWDAWAHGSHFDKGS